VLAGMRITVVLPGRLMMLSFYINYIFPIKDMFFMGNKKTPAFTGALSFEVNSYLIYLTISNIE
jgi:hypothetical protein